MGSSERRIRFKILIRNKFKLIFVRRKNYYQIWTSTFLSFLKICLAPFLVLFLFLQTHPCPNSGCFFFKRFRKFNFFPSFREQIFGLLSFCISCFRRIPYKLSKFGLFYMAFIAFVIFSLVQRKWLYPKTELSADIFDKFEVQL